MDAFVSPGKVLGDTFAPVSFCPLSYPFFVRFGKRSINEASTKEELRKK